MTKGPSTLNTMQKHRGVTMDRLRIFLQERQYSDINLRSCLDRTIVKDGFSMEVYSVPDLKRIPFKEAVSKPFREARVGEYFGPSWSTHWFHLRFAIPKELKGQEVLLRFDPDCEGMIWTKDGKVITGLTGGQIGERHVEYTLATQAKGGEKFEFYIEIACNGLFGNASGIDPPDSNRYFELKAVELVVPNKEARQLFMDMQILIGICEEVKEDHQLSWEALYTGNAIVNAFTRDETQDESLVECRRIAEEFFKKYAKVGPAIHEITAIGNCHIDTAWLWPFAETKRKAARSWSRQIVFMESYPDFKFTASQAQQFEWVEQDYPDLFEKMKSKFKTGQFLPIGGTWVEMDTNVPSGEALCRQFLYGQRFFEKKFGKRCSVFWLPDTFGYSAQLPQLVKQADMKYFFTQKLSWNNINKFPHHTFKWTGLDGTSVLTHFSPNDTYGSQGTVRDITYTVSNNKDKAYSNQSLLCYGNGDGGGGPLIPMIERLKKIGKMEGLPATVKFGSVDEFYEELERTSKDLVEWRGELYFELHRGTYTSHGSIKRHNRKLEILLTEIELLSTLALNVTTKPFTYPRESLDKMWKIVLLCQFHDVLPGSAIGMVYDDAETLYKEVWETGEKLKEDAVKVLAGKFGGRVGDGVQAVSIFNTSPWPLSSAVVEVDLATLAAGTELYLGATWRQLSAQKKALVMVDDVPPMGLKTFGLGNRPSTFSPVTIEEMDQNIVMENAFVKLVLDAHGRVASFYDKLAKREVIAPGQLGNVFKLFEDVPLYWDAWDVEAYHLEKGWTADAGVAVIEETGPVRVSVTVTHPITPTSVVEQRIVLTALDGMVEFETRVKWDENRVLLKVEFPVDVVADTATFETQFGVLERPTHYNTSWDMAKFEVCAHKFADLSESNFGVALFNDCKYGYSVKDNIMRISLLKSPKAPDPNTDMGGHMIRYALYPHKGSFGESDVVKKAYQFNRSPIVKPMLVNAARMQTSNSGAFFEVDKGNVVVDTVKCAEEGRSGVKSGKDVVVRLYEAYGGRCATVFKSQFGIKQAHICNIMEDIRDAIPIIDGTLLLDMKPFQLLSIRLILE